jgi:hypothetical protein
MTLFPRGTGLIDVAFEHRGYNHDYSSTQDAALPSMTPSSENSAVSGTYLAPFWFLSQPGQPSP